MDKAKADEFRERVARWCAANGIGEVKPGRRCIVPDFTQAGNALMNPIVERVFRILREHGAPTHWGLSQAAVLISLVRSKQSTAAFGELLNEACDPVIDSLKQIRDAVNKEFLNPEFVLAMFHLLAPRLWDMDANAIAALFKPSGSSDGRAAIPISSNTVRNARARLKQPRRVLLPSPPSRK